MPEIIIKTNQNFSFHSIVYSHGWSELLPFKIDTENKILLYSFEIHPAKKITVDISSDNKNNIIINSNTKNEDLITSKVKRIFRFDEDLSEFYQIAEQEKEFEWIVEKGAGKMLRCATIWEDMVKMLCTTNCTWRLTQIMTENLFNILGESKSFPSAAVIAETNEQFLREKIKMGYRSPYLLQFAKDVASGNLNLSEFENWDGDSTSLHKEMKKINGFGDYAVSSLMKLLGRYDFMGFDSWNRKQFFNKHKKGKSYSDEQITKFYKKFGKWAGLFYWMDVTKDWYFRDNPWA
jgi:3-methyladenine DNA glycosylase/8-oxoguanine DNA glycosylase